MKHADQNILPEQKEGAKSNVHHIVNVATREEALALYNIAKDRLLDVSNWHKVCGPPTSEFVLTDSNGATITTPAVVGNYFKIEIPAPKTKSGDGYDWVRVEAIDEQQDQSIDCQQLAMRVRPAPNPVDSEQEVSHFFKEEATSTFMVKRMGLELKAEVHGRNELPNTDQQNVIDIVRNTVIALGAMVGLSAPQWKKLAKGLLAADR